MQMTANVPIALSGHYSQNEGLYSADVCTYLCSKQYLDKVSNNIERIK